MTDRVCACHGEPMRWEKDRREATGGFWRCLVKRRISQSRANRIYRATEKGRAADQRYEAQPHRKLEKQLREMTRVRARY